MKYGLLKFLYEDEVQQKVETLNLGDAIQVLALSLIHICQCGYVCKGLP